MSQSWLRLLLCTAAFTLLSAQPELELHGLIDPAPRRASVIIYGADFPFTAETISDSKGRFRFRKLVPGSYTVSVFVPGQGEVRRTITVSPSLAGSSGRVEITFPFEPSDVTAAKTLRRHGTVSLRELRVPDSARREYDEARKKLARHDVDAAVKHFLRAVEIAPHFVNAWNYLGTIAYQSAQYSQAEKYFRTALEHQPGAYEPAVNLGGTLLNLERFQEALDYNRFAVLERPDDALAHSQLGMNFFFLGDLDKALQHLNQAKQLDPAHFSHPQLILAEIHLRRSDRAAAIRELEDFLARHPDTPSAPNVAAQLQRLRQQPDGPEGLPKP